MRMAGIMVVCLWLVDMIRAATCHWLRKCHLTSNALLRDSWSSEFINPNPTLEKLGYCPSSSWKPPRTLLDHSCLYSSTHRPQRFRVGSQDNVYQILRKTSTLRNYEDLKKIFLSPDQTVEERVSRKKLVIELMEKEGADPNHNFVIRKGEIVRVDKNWAECWADTVFCWSVFEISFLSQLTFHDHLSCSLICLLRAHMLWA